MKREERKREKEKKDRKTTGGKEKEGIRKCNRKGGGE